MVIRLRSLKAYILLCCISFVVHLTPTQAQNILLRALDHIASPQTFKQSASALDHPVFSRSAAPIGSDIATIPVSPPPKPPVIMTVNLQVRPYGIDNRSETRMKAIADAIKQHNPDVVLVQELFSESARRKFNRHMRLSLDGKQPYSYIAEGPGRGNRLTNSGLVTYSKYPIVQTDTLEFGVATASDRFANKGALHTRIRKVENGQTLEFDVINTHPQASYKDKSPASKTYQVRQQQFSQLGGWIREKGLKNPRVGGDLNVPARRSHDITGVSDELRSTTQSLGVPLPVIPEGRVGTVNNPGNTYVGKIPESQAPEWLDYVLGPKSLQQEAVDLLSEIPIPSWRNGYNLIKRKNMEGKLYHLTDHKAVIVREPQPRRIVPQNRQINSIER